LKQTTFSNDATVYNDGTEHSSNCLLKPLDSFDNDSDYILPNYNNLYGMENQAK